MEIRLPMEFILRSTVEYCSARFNLETDNPLGEQYRIHCPACKQEHGFQLKTATQV